jgi:hypothetical protein
VIRAGLALTALAAASLAYRDGPPPAHTGAFGEPDCGECHFDAIRDDAAGSLRIDAPGAYQPGHAYTLTIELHQDDLAAGGFQLSARFADGPDAGAQAGTLEPVDERARVQHQDGVAYASHTAAGAAPAAVEAGAGGVASRTPPAGIRWQLEWTAPAEGGPVAFDVAAQVANDDASEFGERLYTARRIIPPSRPRCCGSPGAGPASAPVPSSPAG